MVRSLIKKLVSKQTRQLFDCLKAEWIAVRSGQGAFKEAKRDIPLNSPLLRRNIHRLEKSLCFRERKEVFADNIIIETIELFKLAAASDHFSPTEKKWANDVLAAYFDAVTGQNAKIEKAREIFAKTRLKGEFDTSYSPYALDDLDQYVSGAGLPDGLPEAFTNFMALARSRRSQRYFKDQEIPLEKVHQAVAAATQAPSACNRQPFDFYFTTDRKMIDKIADMPLGTAGFGHQLPGLMAVIGDLSNFSEPRDRHLIYIDAGLAVMQLMLGFTSIGLGSVPINWPDIPENNAKLRKTLGLKEHQVPVMLIGLGVPDGRCRIAYSAKRTVEEILHVVE